MKKVLFVCVLSAGLFASASRSFGADNKAVEQQITKLEQDLSQADLKHDAEAINRIEANEFVYNIDGMKGTKKDDLDDAKSGAFTADTLDPAEVSVHVYGDTAVATGKAMLKNAKYKGKDVSGDYWFTDTWVKRNGHWQIVASHASKAQTM